MLENLTQLQNKIERLPTVIDLQVIEDENPPWINLENNSYVLAISGKYLKKDLFFCLFLNFY